MERLTLIVASRSSSSSTYSPRSDRPAPTWNEVSAGIFAKASSSTLATESGREMDVTPVATKAPSATLASLPRSGRMFTSRSAASSRKALVETCLAPPRSTRVSAGMCQKADAPIVSKASGSVSSRRWAPSKDWMPMRRSVEGRDTDSTRAMRNAMSSIPSTPSAIV